MTSTGFSESDLAKKAKAHQNETQSRRVKMIMDPIDSGEVIEELREKGEEKEKGG